MSRFHGFTCPQCSSHMFGSFKYNSAMGDEFPAGTFVGRCNGSAHYEPKAKEIGCKFQWNRDDPKAEAAVIYHPSEEEWVATFKAKSSN